MGRSLCDIDHYFGADLNLSSNGDLAPSEGLSRSQQRILRRLLSNPRQVSANGDILPADYMWHPEYGAGLPRYIGQTLRPGVIEAAIRGQLLQEDSVARTPNPVISVAVLQDGIGVSIRYTESGSQQPALLSFNVSQ